MTKISKIKNLIAAPENGSPAVRYYLTATAAVISADSDGKPKAPASAQVTFSQWKKVGNDPAVLSADYNIVVFVEKDGVRLDVSPRTNKARTYSVAVQIATGKDCLGADLRTDNNVTIATLGLPVNKDGKPGEGGENGSNAVTYEIVPSASVINADSNGNVTTGIISLEVYKTENENRSKITPGMQMIGGSSPYRVQYSVDGGTWTDCSNVSIGSGATAKIGYGIPGSAVATVKSTLDMRLQKLKDGSYSTVFQIPPIQVVKNGAQGSKGRWYYFDGYFVSTKEYQATDSKAPYVAYEWYESVSDGNGFNVMVTRTSFYMLVANTNKGSNNSLIAPRTQAAAGVWELMEDSFKYMITEAIFSAFAKLGSAVFSGDWLISQYGNGGTDKNYQDFTSFGKAGWHPNFAIDFLKGEVYAGNGKTHFAKDGSADLAGGNLTWDTEGNINIAGFRRKKMRHITQANFGQVMTINSFGEYAPVFDKIGSLVSIDYLPGDIILKLPSNATAIRQYNGEEFLVYNNSGYSFNITGPIVTSETSATTVSYPIPSKWFALFRACIRVIGEVENGCWIMRARGRFA